jgi:hypothetical protein
VVAFFVLVRLQRNVAIAPRLISQAERTRRREAAAT